MCKGLAIAVLLLSTTTLLAKSLGLVGHTYPVAEMSLLALIESRLAKHLNNKSLEEINQDFIKKASQHANRPQPNYLGRTNVTKIHFYTPVVKLTQTMTDHKGRILYPAGTIVNALLKMPSYKPCWFFFDGDDKAQVAFIKKRRVQCQNPKLILTKGSVLEAEALFNEPIYFDQSARIAKKIKLAHVPAIVSRLNEKLKVTEFAIKENGNAI